ncbi:hypothetical protein D9M69_468800 [compost metagenome]
METSRRASGADIVRDLRALQQQNTQERKLRPLGARVGLDAKRGRADWKEPAKAGGGIASPLTEVPGSRIYHEVTTGFYSNDYLIFTEVRPLKSIRFLDANDAEVQLDFALPQQGGG